MSTTHTDTTEVNVRYGARPVRKDGKTVALTIERTTTTKLLGPTGRRKRNSEVEYEFADVGTIKVDDVPELVKELTWTLMAALSDTERGLVS